MRLMSTPTAFSPNATLGAKRVMQFSGGRKADKPSVEMRGLDSAQYFMNGGRMLRRVFGPSAAASASAGVGTFYATGGDMLLIVVAAAVGLVGGLLLGGRIERKSHGLPVTTLADWHPRRLRTALHPEEA